MIKFHDEQLVVIFDGPDMCGKTNMAYALSRHVNVPYFKNSLEANNFGVVDNEYFTKASRYIDTYMTDFLKQTGLSTIFDRNYPSEYAYPTVFNRVSDLDILKRIDDAHAKLDTKIVIPYRSSYEGIVDDVHSNVDESVLIRLDELFQEFCQWTSCDVLRLNVDDEDLDRELEEILTFIGR